MAASTIRATLAAFWKKVAGEAWRLVGCAILAAVVASYFIPGMTPTVILRGLTMSITSVFTDDDGIITGGGEQERWYPVVFLALLAVCIRLIFVYLPRFISKLHSLNEVDSVAASDGPLNPQNVAHYLRLRARQLRRTSQLLLVMIAALVLLGFLMFQSTDSSAIGLYYQFSTPLQNEVQRLTSEVDNLARAKDQGNPALLAQKREELRKAQETLAEMSPTRAFSTYLLFVLGTKLAAVIFLVFFVQLLGNIYRYLTRLAFFNDSRADVLDLLSSSQLSAETLAQILVPERVVEMDPMPSFPVLDQLRSVLKSFAGKG